MGEEAREQGPGKPDALTPGGLTPGRFRVSLPGMPQIPDSMSHLPTYKGLPVPYVAIWSAEHVGPELEWAPKGIRPRTNPQYLRQYRGVLWLDTPDNRTGTPDFGGTHSTRQRNCMADPRCQVCGRKQRAGHNGTLVWVVPDAHDQRTLHDEHDLFINPPICEACFRGALRLCPHLLRLGHNARVYKGNPRITGVHGTFVHPDNRTQIVYLGFKAAAEADVLKYVLGRQYLTTLQDEIQLDVKDFLNAGG